MITNGMTIEQELERYKRWLEDRNIELKETKKHLKIVSELLKMAEPKLYEYIFIHFNELLDVEEDETEIEIVGNIHNNPKLIE